MRFFSRISRPQIANRCVWHENRVELRLGALSLQKMTIFIQNSKILTIIITHSSIRSKEMSNRLIRVPLEAFQVSTNWTQLQIRSTQCPSLTNHPKFYSIETHKRLEILQPKKVHYLKVRLGSSLGIRGKKIRAWKLNSSTGPAITPNRRAAVWPAKRVLSWLKLTVMANVLIR